MSDSSLTVYDLDEPPPLLIACGREDPRQRSDEDVRHTLRRHPFGRMKDETSCAGPHDCDLLARLAADPFVLCKDDPSLPARLAEPYLVIGVLREDIVVGDDARMNLAQSVGNLPSTEAAVDEEVRQRAARGTELPLGAPLPLGQGSIRSLLRAPTKALPRRTEGICPRS